MHASNNPLVRRSRRALTGLIAGGLALLCWLPSAATSTATSGPQLVWTACGDGFDCATALVPLDYDKPRGRAIELALVRLPATDQSRRIGSLFVNPGGPGTSGVGFVRESARTAYPAGVRARFDIVGFDPRGVAASTPVQCFANETARQQFFADYIVQPINAAELAFATGKVRELARHCQARAGWLLPHLSTANVARDLDGLRKAVGDVKLNYVGYSYGTYLGATYANLFPGKVRAVVLDGNTDPTAYASGPRKSAPFVRVNSHLAASATLDQFFLLCARSGPRCEFAAGSDPAAKFATLAKRLRANPLVLPDGLVIDYALLVDFTLRSLYRAPDWAMAASTLQEIYLATSPGAQRAALAALPQDEPAYQNEQEALFASVCSETRNPTNPSDYVSVAAQADRRAPYVGGFWTYLTLPCAVWPAKDADRYDGPWRVYTAHPALVLNNRYDPATDHRNAVRMTELLPGSRLVTVEGWGHTVRETGSTCANAIVERYLVDGTMPQRGTVCQPVIVPFA